MPYFHASMLCVTVQVLLLLESSKLFRKSNESIHGRINLFSLGLSSSASAFNLGEYSLSREGERTLSREMNFDATRFSFGRINDQRKKLLRWRISNEQMISFVCKEDQKYWPVFGRGEVERAPSPRTRKPRKRMRDIVRERERERKEGGETAAAKRGKRKARRTEQSLIVEFWIRHTAFHLSKCAHYSSFYQF